MSQAGLSANLDVLQFLTTEAELANGSNAINVQSALGITGVTSATLSLVVGQLPRVGYGAVGTTASTAQVTADLKLTLSGVSGVVDIPLSAALGSSDPGRCQLLPGEQLVRIGRRDRQHDRGHGGHHPERRLRRHGDDQRGRPHREAVQLDDRPADCDDPDG